MGRDIVLFDRYIQTFRIDLLSPPAGFDPEAISYKTLVPIYQTLRHPISEDRNLNIIRLKNHKSHLRFGGLNRPTQRYTQKIIPGCAMGQVLVYPQRFVYARTIYQHHDHRSMQIQA